jgi:ribosomal protein S25
MSVVEAQEQTLQAFKSNVEDLALEELSRLEQERDELQAQLDLVKTTMREVKAVLAAVGDKKQPRKKHVPGPRTSPRVGEAAKQEVLDWIATKNGDEITANTLRQAFPNKSGSFANIVLKQLREEGLIRQAGQAGSTMIYKAL